jgi:hypothetical protein
MSIEDTIGYQPDNPVCVVCGKSVKGERVFARLNQNGMMVNLCCPLCLDAFQKNPFPYIARLVKVELFQDLKPPTKPTL